MSSEEKLQKAAIKWWEGRRPIEWSAVEHTMHPSINCVTPREQNLANVIALIVRNKLVVAAK